MVGTNRGGGEREGESEEGEREKVREGKRMYIYFYIIR